MGSLFSPSVPSVSPVQFVPSTPAPSTTAQQTQKETQQNTPDTSQEESVKDVIQRRTRGRSSLIQTAVRGVLNEGSALAPQRKSLLGE